MDVGVVPSLLADPDPVSDAVREGGGTPVRDDLGSVAGAEPEVIVVEGDDAMRTAVSAEPEVPLLPIGRGSGIGAVPRDAVSRAIRAVGAGEARVVERRALTLVLRGRDPALALFDVSIVTAEPATISEFEITTADAHVATYRADGVVVATPAGSSGYARAVGGPILDPAADGLVVVTIAPYRTDPDHWVLGDRVEVTVTRDESDVVAVTDGTDLGPVASGSPISIVADRPYRTILVPQSASPLKRGDG